MKKIAIILTVILLLAGYPPAIARADNNLVKNGDFSTLVSGVGAANWITNLPDNAWYQGDSHIRVEDGALYMMADSALLPWVRQTFNNIIPGATYKVTMRVRGTASGYTKVEYSGIDNNGVCSFAAPGDTYKDFETSFIVPEGKTWFNLYPRLMGYGYAYIDDITLTLEKLPPRMSFRTDSAFYYTEDAEKGESGFLYAKFREGASPTAADELLFTVKNMGVTLFSETVKPTATETEVKFPLSCLADKKKGYTASVTLITGGETMETYSETIYKYDRPKALDENGNYIKDGKVFNPVIAYHAFDGSKIDEYAKTGANVFQTGTTGLDNLAAHGKMGLALLYPVSAAVGSTAWYAGIEKTVRDYKDHEAVFAWAILDEPCFFDKSAEMQYALRSASKIIRDIDPVHPVYIMDVPTRETIEITSRFEDVVPIDPYAVKAEVGTYVYESVAMARSVVRNKKPVYAVLKTYRYGYADYLANGDEIRSMLYGAMAAGAKGIGYFCFDDSYEVYEGNVKTATLELSATPLWNELVKIADNELQDLFRLFSRGSAQVTRTSGYIAATVPDGIKTRLLLWNIQNKASSISMEIASSVQIDTFLYGTATADSGGISAEMAPYGALHAIILGTLQASYVKDGNMEANGWSVTNADNVKKITEGGNTYMQVTGSDYAYQTLTGLTPGTSYCIIFRYAGDGIPFMTVQAGSTHSAYLNSLPRSSTMQWGVYYFTAKAGTYNFLLRNTGGTSVNYDDIYIFADSTDTIISPLGNLGTWVHIGEDTEKIRCIEATYEKVGTVDRLTNIEICTLERDKQRDKVMMPPAEDGKIFILDAAWKPLLR